MAEVDSETNTLRGSATSALRKHYKFLLGIVGVSGAGDLVREYVRDHAMDYVMSELGWFGAFLAANPVALSSIGVAVALIILMVMVVSESSREIPSVIYEHRDKRFTTPPAPRRWIAGFVITMLALTAVILFGTYKYWTHTSHHSDTQSSPDQNAKTPLPVIPEQPIAKNRPNTPTETGYPKKEPPTNSSKHQAEPPTVQQPAQSHPLQPQAGPSTPTSQTSQPQTQLERVTAINGNLSPGDRERLSNLLYEFSQILEKMSAVGYRASEQKTQINNEIGDGSIAKDYETHIKELRYISASSKELATSFLVARGTAKWKYYSDQMDYVFGDNPDNLGPNSITNAAEGYASSLEQWSSIKDRENKAALNLFSATRVESDRYLQTFFTWERECEKRVDQMKQSIK
jgi:hypothetical protein